MSSKEKKDARTAKRNDVLKSSLHFLRLTTRVMFCSSKTVLTLLKSVLFTENSML